jgi:hypothetical protein
MPGSTAARELSASKKGRFVPGMSALPVVMGDPRRSYRTRG